MGAWSLCPNGSNQCLGKACRSGFFFFFFLEYPKIVVQPGQSPSDTGGVSWGVAHGDGSRMGVCRNQLGAVLHRRGHRTPSQGKTVGSTRLR